MDLRCPARKSSNGVWSRSADLLHTPWSVHVITVTGAGGVLGRALLKQLRGSTAEPIDIVRSDTLDLRDAKATADYFTTKRPQLVYHLAARVHGLGGNMEFPAEMFSDNVRINTNVVQYAYAAGCRKIVAVSTVAAYSPEAPKPVSESSLWDGPPHGAEIYYGHAKRAMLAQLESCMKQYDTEFVYPLLTNIYGHDDKFDIAHGHVIPSLIAKFYHAKTTGEPVTVWGSGRAERDFLHADDAARALILLAGSGSGAINVASGTVQSIQRAVEILARHTGVRDIRWDATKPDGELQRRYDIERLSDLGFVPCVSLEQGLAETFDWYESRYPAVRR